MAKTTVTIQPMPSFLEMMRIFRNVTTWYSEQFAIEAIVLCHECIFNEMRPDGVLMMFGNVKKFKLGIRRKLGYEC